MYIKNLMHTINNLSGEDFNKFKEIAYSHHFDYLRKHSLVKGDFNNQLIGFLRGDTKRISFDNLDSYLFALDQLHKNGAQNALFHIEKQKQSNDWRILLIKTTSDVSLPKGVNPLHLDDVNIAILKSILKTTLEVTAGSDIDETTKNLKQMNDYMEILVAKMK